MKTPERPPLEGPPRTSAPRQLGALLAEAEGLLAARTRDRLEHGDPSISPPRLRALAQELARCVAEDPAAAARLGTRLADVQTRLALQARDVPTGALAGLYEEVRATPQDASPWARSRMSEAFLDAPRHLVRWRRTALAACALLAVGTGLLAGGRLGFDVPSGARRGADPRDGILERLAEGGALGGRHSRRSPTGTLVSMPGAGSPSRGSAPGEDAPPYWVFHIDRDAAASAVRFLDAVRARAGTRAAERMEHN